MIVPMKKAKLIFMEESKDKVLKVLQSYGLIMPDSKHLKQASISVDVIHTQKAIERIEQHLKSKKIGSNETVDITNFNQIDESAVDLVSQINNKIIEQQELKTLYEQLESELSLVNPYKDLEINTKMLYKLKYLTGYMGKISNEKLENYLGSISTLSTYHEVISKDLNYTYLSLVVMKEEQENLNQINLNNNFLVEKLNEYDDNTQLVVSKLVETIKAVRKQIEDIDSYFESKVIYLSNLKLLHDQLLAKDQRNQIELFETKTTTYVEGWMRSDHVDLLNQLLNDENISFTLDLRDPEGDELSPTALKNNKFVKPFESITNQFSVPNPKEIDPNPLMSFWYWIIFGIMMGDIGYGLLMVIGFGLMLKFGKLKGGIKDLLQVFVYTGITSIAAGFAFGSAFGVTLYKPLIDMLANPMPMLIFSIALGVIHILCALVVKLIYAIRNKDLLGALADAISWILILTAGSAFAVTLFVKLDPLLNNIIQYISFGAIGIGVLLIIILNGRNKTSIAGKAVSAFTGLYNSTAYLSDILSYSRILALALSSGVIAMTFNILGEMVWNSIPFIGIILGSIVYLIGHGFNFVMGLLSAYVHAGRLQYLEYYGKFYEGGGYLYEPLQLQLKYVYKVNLNKESK